MNAFPLLAARLLLAALTFGVMVALTAPGRAQPAEELIDKLLELSKSKKKMKAEKEDDELRSLLVRRYNVAVDELKLRCDDFKKHTATKSSVFEAGKNLLLADLELQDKPAEKVKVLEIAVELVKWYEGRVARAHKAQLLSEADYLRVQYMRMTMEIDLVKLKKATAEPATK